MQSTSPEMAALIFKYIITQEVDCETLLFAQRRQLHHAVALWYECSFGAGAAAGPLLPAAGLPLASGRR